MRIDLDRVSAIPGQSVFQSLGAALGGRVFTQEGNFKQWFHGSAIYLLQVGCHSRSLQIPLLFNQQRALADLNSVAFCMLQKAKRKGCEPPIARSPVDSMGERSNSMRLGRA
jgi:hypothetical protein